MDAGGELPLARFLSEPPSSKNIDLQYRLKRRKSLNHHLFNTPDT
jgi:hypothetical protein